LIYSHRKVDGKVDPGIRGSREVLLSLYEKDMLEGVAKLDAQKVKAGMTYAFIG